MIRLLSIFILTYLCASPVLAQTTFRDKTSETEKVPISAPKGDFSALKHTKSGRVDKIIDGLTVLLKDGTIVRLASLDIPDFHVWESAYYSQDALALLEKLLPEQTEVMMYQTRMAKKGRITRMKHDLAHLVIKPSKNQKGTEDEDEQWVNGALLANGLARVYTAPNAPEMVDQMYKIEQEARAKKIGIWEEGGRYVILTPDNLEEDMGALVLVEGTVQKTASVKNNVYLNFGQNWKTDFTIMITPALRKKFAHEGVDILGLAGQPVRVRGYLREYNGPLIELEDTVHLEILQNSQENPKLPVESLTNAETVQPYGQE